MLTLAAVLAILGLCFFFAALGAFSPDGAAEHLSGYLAAFCWIVALIAFALRFV